MGPLDGNVMDTVFTMPVNAGNGPVVPMSSQQGMTQILVTSASGANGDGYGALLGFSADGVLTGAFSDDGRITDPRGLSLGPAGDLVYVTSGDDRVLALDRTGTVVLDSGRAPMVLTRAGGRSRRTAATASRCGVAGRSWPCPLISIPQASFSCPTAPSRSREDSVSVAAASCTCPRASVPPVRVTTRSPRSTAVADCAPDGW